MVTYIQPPGVDLSENEYRAASKLTLTCMVEGASGTVTYVWMTSFNNPNMQSITRDILRPADTRTHTCTATDENSNTGSASTVVRIVGKFP